MEAGERPERREAERSADWSQDEFRGRALEKQDEWDLGGAPEASGHEEKKALAGEDTGYPDGKERLETGQPAEGLERFREHIEERYPDEFARAPSIKESTSVAKASAMVPVEPAPEQEGSHEVRLDVGTSMTKTEVESDEVQMGGYERRQDLYTVIEREASPAKPEAEAKLETEGLHHFPADSEAKLQPEAEEVRTLEVVDYGKGAVLRVPKTDLEEAGFEPEAGQNSIVELKLKNAESEDVKTVFARYVASDRRAEAYVGDISGEKGSKYELVEASEHDEDRFAKDFERGKCEHLQNVRLEYVEDRMFMVVDDRRVELEDYRLATSGSHVVLRGELGGDSDCKIEFDGRRSSVRFGRDYPVEAMRMQGDELVVGYAQSRNERHEHRMYLEHLNAPEQPSLNQFDKPEMLEHVKMFDYPERVEGVYQFVVDKAAQKEVGTLLDDALDRGDKQYGLMKAEVSERLVGNLLELAEWERIEWHPFNETKKEGASANGTDWLLRTPDGELALVEVKWWTDVARAEYKGESQVVKDLIDHPYYKGERIVGAYVATMCWDVDDLPMKVYLKRALPEADLK